MKKKKFNWSGFLTVIIGIGTGILISLALTVTDLITENDSFLTMILKIVWLFAAFIVATYLQVVIHEGGHLLAGLKSGYHFVSFRIGKMMWIKDQNGKLVRKNFELAGTAGQCIMGPPEYNADFRTALYNYGGVIANAVSALVFLILYFLIPVPAVKMFNFVMAITGLMNAVINGIPMVTSSVANDGHNEKECRRNERARRAFWAQLKVTELMSKGQAVYEIPDDLFETAPDRDFILINSSYIMRINRFMNKKDYRKCRKLMEHFLEGDYNMNPYHRQLLQTDLLYCRIIDGEDVNSDYQELAGFFNRMKTILSVIRTQYAYEKVVVKNEAKADEYLRSFEKQAATYPYPRDIETEKGLIELADSKVYNE